VRYVGAGCFEFVDLKDWLLCRILQELDSIALANLDTYVSLSCVVFRGDGSIIFLSAKSRTAMQIAIGLSTFQSVIPDHAITLETIVRSKAVIGISVFCLDLFAGPLRAFNDNLDHFSI